MASEAIQYTFDFVQANLPPGPCDILELGSGAGELALLLNEAGHRTVAIDQDETAVASARKLGVDAHCAEWPAPIEGLFDAVLFTRSLHHMHALEESVACARSALKPGGRLIIEDFRAEGGTPRSSAWFITLGRVLHEAGAFGSGFDLERIPAMLDVGDHAHELHSSDAIAQSLAGLAEVRRASSAYYFRYLEPYLREPPAAGVLLEHELALIEVGSIDPLGVRFIARH